MAFGYVPVDRDQQFLLPPDVREWLRPGHLAWFVLDVVARLDTSVLHARHGNDGVGRRAYDPDMMLVLLVYAYCTGQRSSRVIERLCEVDVACRVICANSVPDHTTIARFRQVHEAAAAEMFTDVLVLCASVGLATVGVVAVDGTKMGCDAALRANRTRARIEAEVAAMLGEAAAVDAAEDALFGATRGDELPAELADPRARRVRLDAALAELEAQRAARQTEVDVREEARRKVVAAAAELGQCPKGSLPIGPVGVAEAEARLEASLAADTERAAAFEARRLQAELDGLPRRGGRRPGESVSTRRARKVLVKAQRKAGRPAAKAPPAEPVVNTTDPDSRAMISVHGWVQGYNAQAAVNAQGVVLAAAVTQDVNDCAQCQPMMAATRAQCDAAGITDQIGTMLFDAGYCSEANLAAPGPDRLIATTKSYKLKKKGLVEGPPPPGGGPIEAMEHRLRTEAGAALYGMRQHTVEPVFGNIKDGRGFRRFTRRGHSAAAAEWHLITATHNMLKAFRAGAMMPATT